MVGGQVVKLLEFVVSVLVQLDFRTAEESLNNFDGCGEVFLRNDILHGLGRLAFSLVFIERLKLLTDVFNEFNGGFHVVFIVTVDELVGVGEQCMVGQEGHQQMVDAVLGDFPFKHFGPDEFRDELDVAEDFLFDGGDVLVLLFLGFEVLVVLDIEGLLDLVDQVDPEGVVGLLVGGGFFHVLELAKAGFG